MSLENGLLPLGLTHDVRLRKDVEAGNQVAYDDVEADESSTAINLRRELETHFNPGD